MSADHKLRTAAVIVIISTSKHRANIFKQFQKANSAVQLRAPFQQRMRAHQNSRSICLYLARPALQREDMLPSPENRGCTMLDQPLSIRSSRDSVNYNILLILMS